MDLHIDHLDCRYRTPGSAAEASIVKERLDLIANSFLARVWEENASKYESDAIYFIESIEVDLTLDASRDDQQLARTWARELHKGVAQTLGLGGPGIVMFANRAEFLASFLGALLRGNPWNDWYYHEFAPLSNKSTAQVASTVLIAEPDIGRDALILLAERGDLDLLLATLGDHDLEIIVERCLLPESQRFVLPNSYAKWAGALRQLLSTRQMLLTNNLPRDIAGLYLGLLVESPSLGPDVHLARFISELLHLRNSILGLNDTSGFLRLVASEACDRAFSAFVDSQQRRFAFALAGELGGQNLSALLRDLQITPADTETRRISTRYGGLFLLAMAATALGLDTLLRKSPYPDPAGADKSNLLLYVIALQCLGNRSFVHANRDSGPHLFAGLDAAPANPYLERYAEKLTNEMHESFQMLFQSHATAVAKRSPGLLLTMDEVSSERTGWFRLPFEGAMMLLSQALEPVSRALIRLFASSLGAFGDSSPGYLSRNFLECSADVEISSNRIEVRFLTCPLQMILRMAGFDHARPILAWLEDRELSYRFD